MADPTIQFTPREMIEALRLRPRPTTFLSDLLIKKVSVSSKTHFQIDQDFGDQSKAGYTSRDGDPTEIAKRGYNSTLHVAPYIDERITFTPKDVDVRLAGENEWETDASETLDNRVASWLVDLEDRFIRAEEDQIAEILQTGKLHVTGKDVDYEIDFGVPADHIVDVSGSAPWTSTSGIYDQISEWVTKVSDDNGMTITDVITGSSAAAPFRQNEEILTLLDNRRAEYGRVEMRNFSRQRVSRLGALSVPGADLEFWNYQGGYKTSGGFTRFIDPKKVVLVARDLEVDRQYAKIENFGSGFVGRRYADVYFEQPRGRKGYAEMESSPITILRDPISIFTAQVIV